MQQVLAFESDLLEYGDLFEGSTVVEAKVDELSEAAWEELQWVLAGGGAFEMIDDIKGRLVQSNTERVRRIESGDIEVVGVNRFTETEPSPLTAGLEGESHILVLDPEAEAEQIAHLQEWRRQRDPNALDAALSALRESAATDENLMPATIALAKAGGTVGDWASTLREVFGEYRAPTGIGGIAASVADDMLAVRAKVQAQSRELGGPPKVLVGKPGLDGHANGAEQIAVAARDAGMEVVYQGIRLTPAQIAAAARDEDVDVVGISILSGSHRELVPDIVRQLRALDVDAPVVVGGIIPEADQAFLTQRGVTRVYTPKDYRLAQIMGDLADLALDHRRNHAKSTTKVSTPVDPEPMDTS
jgi:(2R)-ethylmalonyl-CoA mutase